MKTREQLLEDKTGGLEDCGSEYRIHCIHSKKTINSTTSPPSCALSITRSTNLGKVEHPGDQANDVYYRLGRYNKITIFLLFAQAEIEISVYPSFSKKKNNNKFDKIEIQNINVILKKMLKPH